MAYTDNFPQRPVFMADFANGGRIDPRATFSRSDSPIDATKAAASAVHYWSNEKHLSSENLVLQSDNYGSTPWLDIYDLTPTGSQTAPDGSSNAWLLTPTAGTNPIRIQQAITLEATTAYTASCYMKAGAATHGFMSVRGTSSHYAQVTVDFSDPTNPSSSGVSFTSVSATSTAVGSTGWYKVVLNFTSSSVVTSERIHISPTDGTGAGASGIVTWTSAGNETMYLWGVQLNTTGATVYDSPTTTQISRSYASSLKSVTTAGQPRFEYDPASDGQSAARGILIESQATNLVTYSSDITQSFFTGFRSTRESNVGIAPDGTLTADLLREDSTSGDSHGVYFQYASGGTTAQTISVYAKAAGRNHLLFRFDPTNGVFASDFVSFNLSTGAVGTTDSDITASIESCGNGWYRCIATRTALASANGRIVLYLGDADNSALYNGDNYSGVLLWGIQAEANSSHASSMVSTSGSAATRAAESLSVATADIGYTGGPVSVVAEVDGGRGNVPYAFSLSDGTYGNRVYVNRNSSSADESTDWSIEARVGGASVASIALTSSAAAGKLGVSYDTNSVSVCASGGAVITDTTAPLLHDMTKLQVGAQFTGNFPLNGHVKRVALYNEALTDTNLQALTS
jgi:hypothetical protein